MKKLKQLSITTYLHSGNINKLVKEIGHSLEAKRKKEHALKNGKLWVDDVIADVVFEKLITKPQNFDVIATTNLNGDYISDAAAALAGGVGISPGANINTHPRYRSI